LVNELYKTTFAQVDTKVLFKIYESIYLDIEMFINVYKSRGAQGAKKFKYYADFLLIAKKLDVTFDNDLDIAKQVLLDKYFNAYLKNNFNRFLFDIVKHFFLDKQDVLLTYHPFAKRHSHEVVGGIATGKSTLVQRLQREANGDLAYISSDAIAPFLEMSVSSPFNYLTFQLCYDELLQVKLQISAQLEMIAVEYNKLPNCVVEAICYNHHHKSLMLRGGGKLSVHITMASDPIATLHRAFNRAHHDRRYMASDVILYTQKEASAQLAEDKMHYVDVPVQLISQITEQMSFYIHQQDSLVATCNNQKMVIYDNKGWKDYLRNIHINAGYKGGDDVIFPADIETRILESEAQVQKALKGNHIKFQVISETKPNSTQLMFPNKYTIAKALLFAAVTCGFFYAIKKNNQGDNNAHTPNTGCGKTARPV
jgi:hypothetical protein